MAWNENFKSTIVSAFQVASFHSTNSQWLAKAHHPCGHVHKTTYLSQLLSPLSN